MIMKCVCGDYRQAGATFQNERYGYGMRVHSPLAKNNKGKFRCSVCGAEHGQSGADKPKEAGK